MLSIFGISLTPIISPRRVALCHAALRHCCVTMTLARRRLLGWLIILGTLSGAVGTLHPCAAMSPSVSSIDGGMADMAMGQAPSSDGETPHTHRAVGEAVVHPGGAFVDDAPAQPAGDQGVPPLACSAASHCGPCAPVLGCMQLAGLDVSAVAVIATRVSPPREPAQQPPLPPPRA